MDPRGEAESQSPLVMEAELPIPGRLLLPSLTPSSFVLLLGSWMPKETWLLRHSELGGGQGAVHGPGRPVRVTEPGGEQQEGKLPGTNP